MDQCNPQAMRLLLVDNDPLHVRACLGVLTESGFETQVCAGVEQAQRALESGASRVQAIVCRQQLPGDDPLAWYARLRAAGSRIPFVTLVAAGQEELAVRAIRAGVDGHVIRDSASRYLVLLPELLRRVVATPREYIGRLETEPSGCRTPAASQQEQAVPDLLQEVQLRKQVERRLAESDVNERTQVERTVRESERRMRLLTDAMPAFIAYVDHQQRFQFSNAQYETFFGLSRADIRGRHVREVLGEDAYQIVRPQIEAALRGERFVAEERVPIRGAVRDYEVRYVPQKAADGAIAGYYMMAVDVTERKASEQELRDLNARLSVMLESMPVASFLCRPDGNYGATYVSESVEALTGYASQRFVSDPDFWADRLHPDDAASVLQGLSVLGQQDSHEHEHRWRVADGSYKWFYAFLRKIYDDDGSVKHLVGMWQDITERKQAEEALRQSEERLRFTTDHAPAVLWSTDLELVITSSTGGALADIHLKPGQVVGQTLYAFAQTDDPQDPLIQAHLKALQGGSDCYETEFDGRTFECRVQPVRNPAGEVSGCVGIGWDVTERIAMEAALCASEQRMRLVTNAMPAIIAYTGSDLRIQYANAEFERLTGVGPGQLVGRTVRDVLGEQTFGIRKPYIERALAGEATVTESELTFAGELPPRMFQVSYIPHHNEAGKVVGYFTLAVDLSQRVEAERRLRDSEQRFRAIVENSHDLIAMYDEQRLLYLNPAGHEMLGLDSGTDWNDQRVAAVAAATIWHQDREHLVAEARQALGSSVRRIDQPLRLLDGTMLHVEGVGTTIQLQGRPVQVSIVRDVTERREAEMALAESEGVARERFAEIEQLYRTAPIGLCHVDSGMRYVRINDKLAAIHGLSVQDHIGRLVREVLPEQGPAIEARYRRILETGEPVQREMRAATAADPERIKDWLVDEYPLLDEKGNVLGIQSTVLDITDHKRAEERFRLAVESAPNAMVMVSAAGLISMVNSEAETCFGYDRSEMLNQPIEMLMPDRYRALHRAYRERYLTHPETRRMGAVRELFGRRKDGCEFPVEVGLNPLETSDGMYVLASVTDISLRVDSDKKLALHREQLAHMGRVHLAGEMASGIAHEMNQPLVTILLKSEVCRKLLESGASAAQLNVVRESLGEIASQAKRAGQIVNFLRNFVRRKEPHRSTHHIDDIIKRALDNLKYHAREEKMDIQYVSDRTLPHVAVDNTQIEQVLINLLRNACEATEKNGADNRRVRITTCFSSDNEVQIHIADNGCGTSCSDLNQLFESFYTTKTDGMGLGLAICRSIIEAHGGRFWASRNDDRGLTFHFSLRPQSAAATSTHASSTLSPLGR